MYTFGALFGLAVLLITNIQVLGMYTNGGGFDVPAEDFYYSVTIVYLPFFIINGYLLRLLIERWRVYIRSKKMFYITEYDAPKGFTPAHAGMLIDNDIRIEEVVATLYDLQRRGVLSISDADITLRTTSSQVTSAEKCLIDVLFSRGASFHLNKTNTSLFLSASHEFRQQMLEDMRRNHMLPMPNPRASLAQKLLGGAFMIFSYVAIVLMAYLIFNPSYILDIQYPRYNMEVGQPILVVMIALLVCAIAFSGFATSLFGRDGRLTWRLAAGYRLYINTVFKGKFEYGKDAVNSKEQNEILPYAIAFSIEKIPVQDFTRKLGL